MCACVVHPLLDFWTALAWIGGWWVAGAGAPCVNGRDHFVAPGEVVAIVVLLSAKGMFGSK